MSGLPDVQRERQRQQWLLGTLLGDAQPSAQAWYRTTARTARGLAAYRANAGALAERALAAAFPTLQQLLGEASFAGLSRAFWQRHPPEAGDIALWGGALPAFVAEAESLQDEPYLGDVARLEWAVHCAASAADAGAPQGLQLLAEADPGALRVQLAPGTALVSSAHPVASIWQAHRDGDGAGDGEDRFAAVREAFAAGRGEHALVQREGWRVRVHAVPEAQARFIAAALAGVSLAQALHEAGDGFDFEPWFIGALQGGQLVAITPLTEASSA